MTDFDAFSCADDDFDLADLQFQPLNAHQHLDDEVSRILLALESNWIPYLAAAPTSFAKWMAGELAGAKFRLARAQNEAREKAKAEPNVKTHESVGWCPACAHYIARAEMNRCECGKEFCIPNAAEEERRAA